MFSNDDDMENNKDIMNIEDNQKFQYIGQWWGYLEYLTFKIFKILSHDEDIENIKDMETLKILSYD